MFVQSCDAMINVVMKCIIECSSAGMASLARGQLGNQVVIEYYIGTLGTLMCTNLYKDKNIYIRYRKEVMSVKGIEFQTYLDHISDDVRGSNGKRFNAWTEPSCSIHFVILMMIRAPWNDTGLHEWGKS